MTEQDNKSPAGPQAPANGQTSQQVYLPGPPPYGMRTTLPFQQPGPNAGDAAAAADQPNGPYQQFPPNAQFPPYGPYGPYAQFPQQPAGYYYGPHNGYCHGGGGGYCRSIGGCQSGYGHHGGYGHCHSSGHHGHCGWW